ncbi:MAG: SDR family oxidoreductase [Candidatus Kariarchaeaceae archaeon]|jgi:NAD(P)-dependent dehydrogenase (short-subunit alcohol dehydrogenase family)
MTSSTITQENENGIQPYWQGKKVLITGGTAGLGRSLAINLHDMGAQVAIVARTKESIEELLITYPNIIGINADISEKKDIHKISGQALGQLEGIDVLINNASSLGPVPLKSLIQTECEDLSHVLETNLLGPFRLIKAVLPTMILQKSGVIINISSDAAVSAYETWGAYSISKAALDHLTRIWQEELKAQNVRIVSVDPGDMATQLHFAAIPSADPTNLYDPSDVASDLVQFISLEETDEDRYSASQWRAYL